MSSLQSLSAQLPVLPVMAKHWAIASCTCPRSWWPGVNSFSRILRHASKLDIAPEKDSKMFFKFKIFFLKAQLETIQIIIRQNARLVSFCYEFICKIFILWIKTIKKHEGTKWQDLTLMVIKLHALNAFCEVFVSHLQLRQHSCHITSDMTIRTHICLLLDWHWISTGLTQDSLKYKE